MSRLILAALLLVAAPWSAQEPTPYQGLGESPALTGASHSRWGVPPPPAAVNVTASEPSGTSSMPGTIRGTATWYCGGGSPCTRGYGPQDLVAAIDPSTGIPKGERLTVWHGDRSVTVRVVDVCACAGARIIDLSRLAFSRLADPSRGVIAVTINPARTSQEAPAMTLPPTDTGGMP